MKSTPCPILVVTSTVAGNSSKVFDAMGHGALDAVCTPVFGSKGAVEGGKDLIKKIEIIAKLIGIEYKKTSSETINYKYVNRIPTIIAIGSSTGGPKALASILNKLPRNFDASIVIVQHVDLQFASGLALWLNEQTELDVHLIKEGMKPENSNVYLAGTNDHLVIDVDGTLYYTAEPVSYPYRPSVNIFFRALADNYKKKGIAVILTGMGNDGANGLKQLYEKGWYTIAQDKSSSIVFGMPKAAIETKCVDQTLHIDEIAKVLVDKVRDINQ